LQAFGGRRTGISLEGEQVGDGGIGVRQVYFRSVYYLLAGRVAASYLDGLGAVMGLQASGAARFAGLCASAIDRLGEFVSGIVDDIPFWLGRRNERLKAGDALGKDDDCDEEQDLDQPCAEKSAIREDADGCFAGKSFGSAG
jgi:hypothetical protein